jgi:ABC-2 type transport system permease protein
MSAILALTRAQWLTMSSYRLQFLLSIGGMLVSIVPLYFIANAVQPIMADSISGQGGQAFDFLLIGTVTMSLIPLAVNGLPNALSGSIRTGTLEAMMATPTSLASILAGMMSLQLLIAAAQMVLMFVAGTLLGADIAWTRIGPAFLTIGLIVLSYLPFGLLAGALILLFRTAGPISKLVIAGTALLGGVYYPTHVIPSWLELLSRFIPMTYGLRALRQILLEDQTLASVMPDLLRLSGGTVALLLVTFLGFRAALSHSRHSGTLAHY